MTNIKKMLKIYSKSNKIKKMKLMKMKMKSRLLTIKFKMLII